MADPKHPGSYIREKVIPPAMSVKDAAKVLGVSRPTVSKMLSGKAALSAEMAARLEKAFGADAQKLVLMQSEFDQYLQESTSQSLPIGAYVPSFLKITARSIEEWVTKNPSARPLIAVLLRKLIHATGSSLSLVDFPGYETAERKGWDGRVDTVRPTPWIPLGKSGWEFGCDAKPRTKAEKDYLARTKDFSTADRFNLTFVFVTPRLWDGKNKWVTEKQHLGEWKSVRAYDASDLEQWVEQAIPVQGWLAEQIGLVSEGVCSLDDQWRKWATVTSPELSRDLFASSVEQHQAKVKAWLQSPASAPFIACGDSKLEVLAFLDCLFESSDPIFKQYKDRALVFSSAAALRKLTTASPSFNPIVLTEEAERELGGPFKNRHTIILRPRNTIEPTPNILLDLLTGDSFRKALEAMGITDHLKANEIARRCGRSRTILRRQLSQVPAIRTPDWARDSIAARQLIPMMLVGAWHSQSKGDCEILAFLAGAKYAETEESVVSLLRFDDSPVWSAGTFRGVSSKIDAFFAIQTFVTSQHIETFLVAAEIVLSEKDPSLELPDNRREFAQFFGKTRDHSSALRDGICETLVLLAAHGNDLFRNRLGIELPDEIDSLIRRLLSPLTTELLLSHSRDLPLYAEAAPSEFLRIIEGDLKLQTPAVYGLMKPAPGSLFTLCPRTGLLCALEGLAWNSEQLSRVTLILAKLCEHQVSDNWANTPQRSLETIFRSWMPQTAASIEDRKKALEVLARKFPRVAWKICVDQLVSGRRVGEYSYRPRWRSDASGFGRPASSGESIDFAKKALSIALAWPNHDEQTLGDLVENVFNREEVWNLVEQWAARETNEERKAVLRERIRRFALSRISRFRGLKPEFKDRAQMAYELLKSADPVYQYKWLFEHHWVDEPIEEDEDSEPNYQKQEDQVHKLRAAALIGIWKASGFDGILTLLMKCSAASTIGSHLALDVMSPSAAPGFIERCLQVEVQDALGKLNELMRGYLISTEAPLRREIIHHCVNVLPASLAGRLLKYAPFEHETWAQVDLLDDATRLRYWREVESNWMMKTSPDLNEAVDRLLGAGRPQAAFHAVQFTLEQIETSRLKKLLQELGTNRSEAVAQYSIDAHEISEALNILQSRVGINEEELARIEFTFIAGLEHTPHGFPNLERLVAKSPSLFVEALALIYKRDDGGEDPKDWQIAQNDEDSHASTAAFRLLEKIEFIPGTDNLGKVDEEALKAWVREVQALCIKYGRAQIGDQKLGRLLSAPKLGDDGIWPCEEVRNVLEEFGNSDVATGVRMGVYNGRGAHFRSEGGELERDLAGKYRNWARKLASEHPYVSDTVAGIALTYDKEAMMWDSEAAVRRRLRH